TRVTPGPVGLYVVSVGYFVGGVPGAIMGWAALATPALLIVPLVVYVGRRAENRRVKSVLQAIVLSSAGLLWAAAVPIARDTLTTPFCIVIFGVGLLDLLPRDV